MHLSQTNLISNTSCAPSISVILFPFVFVQLLSCLTLCDPKNCSMQASLSFAISQSLLKLMFIGDAIQPSHPLSPPSPPAFNLSQHQGLF